MLMKSGAKYSIKKGYNINTLLNSGEVLSPKIVYSAHYARK